MKTFNVSFKCDNEAFQECERQEIARILKAVALAVENGEELDFFRTVRDINGNDVGRYKLIAE